MIKFRDIILAGNGHGAIAALESLRLSFRNIKVCSEDEQVLSYGYDSRDIESCEGDLIICAGYSKLISDDLIKRNIIVNTHPSLLPEYRGIHSLAWAMINLEDEVGFTVHLMDKWIDNGPILAQYKTKVESKTSKIIMDEFDLFVKENLSKIIADFVNGIILPRAQDFRKASWCCKRNLDDCILNFNVEFEELHATFRALVPPYPKPIIKVGNKLYQVEKSKIKKDIMNMHVGRVVNIQDGQVYIKFKNSLLLLEDVLCLETRTIFKAVGLFKLGQRLL
ncbi:formyltransferase family protein [Vibrio echinoideorum]|uniref:phosphoribosylglycinamide formyltransferase 1 n=1 Tax=Vibrio echinoideorum TaxID=2100116 RepID=A0ABU9FUD7_9VIBR